jgi:hypothetical protein
VSLIERDAAVQLRQIPRGPDSRRDAVHDAERQLRQRDQRERDEHGESPRCGARAPRERGETDRQREGHQGEEPPVEDPPKREPRAVRTLARARPVAQRGLQVVAAGADEVVADVTPNKVRRVGLQGLAGALDRGARDVGFADRTAFRQLLQGVPVSVPAREVHARVDARGIPAQLGFNDAAALEEGAPVGGIHEPDRRDRVRDGDLIRGLSLVLGLRENQPVTAETSRSWSAIRWPSRMRNDIDPATLPRDMEDSRSGREAGWSSIARRRRSAQDSAACSAVNVWFTRRESRRMSSTSATRKTMGIAHISPIESGALSW